MKHSLVIKFLAIMIAACSLVAAFSGTVGIVAMESAGLYINGVDELQDQEYESIGNTIASAYANRYAAKNLGHLPYILRENLYSDPLKRSDAEHWCVRLREGDQVLAEEGLESGAMEHNAFVKDYRITVQYPIVSLYGPDELPPATSEGADPDSPNQPEPLRSEFEETEVPDGYLYYDLETVWQGARPTTYYLYYYEAPEYTVTVYLQEEVLESSALHILTSIYPHRYTFIAVLAAGLALFAACIVYLCWSAGRANDGSIRPGGLNLIPLDLYAGAVVLGMMALVWLFLQLVRWIENEGPHPGNLSLLGTNLLGMALLGIAFLLALCAQIKIKGNYWWHHSAAGWCWGKLTRGIRFLWNSGTALLALLPLIWQWVLTAVVLAIATLIAFMVSVNYYHFHNAWFFLMLLVDLAVVIYCGYALGTLLSGVREMTKGNLHRKIRTRFLFGSFRDFAQQLNALSETAMVAAQNQMKSERMKSELITNVSHDIKTPLTSIINFVDLLQKPHSEAEEAEYLEVLSRQSARMKKLIEDLMELSKANTGNITANIVTLDAVETVNQALGEFSDRLAAARLTPVFRQPEVPVYIRADGRLAWRVISNVLTNAVKYALPGTRLYVELAELEGDVLLSVKNISREELRLSAEELMERFVQGDTSRHTDGSGLGLNIARSLMEVQHGRLNLLLDGDLFKVTLVFPSGK